MTAETLLAPGRPLTTNQTAARGSRLTALVRGRTEDARWVRPTLIGLLLATALLYLWGLGASGYANSFYSAAAQAGSQSWKAMFFGSSDASNAITVDKPPVSLWAMSLSIRVFGLNSWSILAPQALEGVAAVGFLYLTVRRIHGPLAGLIAGVTMAVTPVAALMFRFNNPDAMLVLLMTIAAYCVLRALETASTKWLVICGVLVGFGFLTKMLQVLLVVPAFALAYLIAAPTPLRRRILQLLAGGTAMVAGAGWWIALVSIIPAKDRPYIGGSQHNSILELTFGYNGFGRLTGNETGSVGGGAAGTGNRWGTTGWSRLLGSQMGNEIAFLLPTALAMIAVGLFYSRRTPRTDRARASVILWGGWLLTTWAVFSFASGIIHPYYTVALAPAVGALIGIGAVMLWQRRDIFSVSIVMALLVGGTTVWNFIVLDRDHAWMPWIRYSILIAGTATALLLLLITRFAKAIGTAIAAVALIASLGGSTAYAVATAANSHTGAIPSAGPASAGSGGFGGGGNRPGGFGGAGRANRAAGGTAAGGTAAGGGFQLPKGGTGGGTGGGGTARGGMGGLFGTSTPTAAVTTALKANASKYTWVAATNGSDTAAGYQLASQEPVMAIGGFNSTDPSPTLAQFQAYVSQGKIHYYISGGGGFGGGQSTTGTASSISTWVSAHFKAVTIGGVSMYDLTQPAS